MEPLQQPYNLFAQQKMAGYPGYQTLQKRTPGQVHGETVGQFAQGKQAANSQTGAVSQPVLPPKGTNQGNGSIKVTDNGTIPAATETGGPRTPVYTGGANNPQGVLDYLTSQFTSPEEEERLRKASIANQRILAVGDALRHIGNIYNTVNYAPAQQFSKPVEEERTRYLQEKAMRDAVNRQYIAYQQAKAAQDAKQRQWEAEQNYKSGMLKHYQDQDRRLWERDAETAIYHEGILGLRKEKQKLDDDYRNKRISIDEYNARSRRISAMASAARAGGGSRGGSGSNMPDYDVVTTYERDDEGRVKSAKKTRTVKHSDGTTSTSTKTTKPQKKALPGQTQTQPQKKTKKKLPGM